MDGRCQHNDPFAMVTVYGNVFKFVATDRQVNSQLVLRVTKKVDCDNVTQPGSERGFSWNGHVGQNS